MNRQARRASAANGRKLAAGGWSPFVEVKREDVAGFASPWPSGCDAVWKNSAYVMFRYVHETDIGRIERLLVRRNDAQPVRSWADLQRIKDELIGPERTAVEVYPPASELVDDANCYHLWALPPGAALPFSLVHSR
jgi:hypothetical protein